MKLSLPYLDFKFSSAGLRAEAPVTCSKKVATEVTHMMTQELAFARFRQHAGWTLSLRFFLVLCGLEPAYISIAAAQVTFTTFDVPAAGTNQNQGTVPVAINPAGAITGSCAIT